MKTKNVYYISYAYYTTNYFRVIENILFCKESLMETFQLFSKYPTWHQYSTAVTNFNAPSGYIWIYYNTKDVHNGTIVDYNIMNIQDINYLYQIAPSRHSLNLSLKKNKNKGKSPRRRFVGKISTLHTDLYWNETFGNFTKQEYKHNFTCIEEGVKFKKKRNRGKQERQKLTLNGWKDRTKCKHQWEKNIKKHPNNQDVFIFCTVLGSIRTPFESKISNVS